MLNVVYAQHHLCCVEFLKVMLSVFMRNVVALSVIILNVVVPSVIMLNVVAPGIKLLLTKLFIFPQSFSPVAKQRLDLNP
jgi:hypothetical protein